MSRNHRKPHKKNMKLLPNKIIGDLTVIEYVIDKGWLCRCSCGSEIYRSTPILVDAIKLGQHSSCKTNKHRNGYPPFDSMPEYHVWMSMRARCKNKNRKEYERYGGRGIKVCQAWNDPNGGFLRFMKEVGRRPTNNHTIERINNEGNYEPGNVKWATQKVQARNRRSSHFVEAWGERKTIAEWSETTGIEYEVIRKRLKRGLEPEVALKKFAKVPTFFMNGEDMPLSYWAKKYGIPRSTIRNRINRGMSFSDAVKT